MKRIKHTLAVLLAFCMTAAYMPSFALNDTEGAEGVDETSVDIEMTADDAEETAEPAPESDEEAEEAAPEAGEAAEPGESSDKSPPETNFAAGKEDYIAYDPLYIARYADQELINAESIDMSRFINVVTAAKGIATYNIRKDAELGEKSFLAGMTYELPVYNVDDESRYYVAVPNVNKFNGSNFEAFGLTVGYNNDFAETISGWKYRKGILYIPKSAVDRPKNTHDVPENAVIAVQLNYAIGADMDFSKTIPVQILSGREPATSKVRTDNIFDVDALTVETGVRGRKPGDISVFLNGQMIPVFSEAWEYDSSNGRISIKAMPGVVSGINIVFQKKKIRDRIRDIGTAAAGLVADEAYAAQKTLDSMTVLKNATGQEVTLTFDKSSMFVGWRGHYTSPIKYGNSYFKKHEKDLDGYLTSRKYLYGGYTTHSGSDFGSASNKEKDQWLAPLWAIQSYAAGADARKGSGNAGVLEWNEQVSHYYLNSSDQGAMTIYEWLMLYRNSLEKAADVTAGTGNGIGGSNNFAAHWPVNQVVAGAGSALAHPGGTPLANPDMYFETADISADQWYAAGCTELGDAAETEEDGAIFVTCLGLTDDYVVLAFVQTREGQNMTAIYKFRAKDRTGFAKIKKVSEKPGITGILPGAYSLQGAEYRLYTDPSCTAPALDAGGAEAVLVTDGNGDSNTLEMTVGSYYCKETAASMGFMFDSAVKIVEVRYQETTVIESKELPALRNLSLELRKTDLSGRNGYKNLIGTEYTISHYDVFSGYGERTPSEEDIKGLRPVRSWTFRAVEKKDADGRPYAGISTATDEAVAGSDPFFIDGGARVLPCGIFTIKEKQAAPGMARDENTYYGRVYQPSNGSDAAIFTEKTVILRGSGQSSTEVTDDVQHPVIEIRKEDEETGRPEPQGADREVSKGSFKGAEYAVYYDDPKHGSPERVGTIVTDEEGYGKLERRTEGDERLKGEWLDLGRYFIEEIKAPPGYTLDKYCSEEQTGEYSDGKHIIYARAYEGNTYSFTYKVRSIEKAHHTYIRKTDIATSKELPGATLQVINEEGEIVEEWVSSEEAHDIAALPDGRYTLREITAPYGYDIAEDVTFEVKEDVVENTVEMKNRPLSVGTNALDEASMTHHGVFAGKEIIRDRVSISGLTAGRTYRVKGCVVDRASGNVLKDSTGNAIEAESEEFTAESESTEIELVFAIDSSLFTKDSSVVVFEKLYRTSRVREDEELPKELAKHENPMDEPQVIRYGGLAGTYAYGDGSKDKNVLAGKKAVVTDVVKYSNLSTVETYTLEGELYDKTEGRLTGIRAVAAFRPELPGGTTTVEFKFDASEYEGHTMVVFETLKLNDRVIDRHENPDDRDQTVYIVRKGSPKTGDSTGLLMHILVILFSAALISLIAIGRRRCR